MQGITVVMMYFSHDGLGRKHFTNKVIHPVVELTLNLLNGNNFNAPDTMMHKGNNCYFNTSYKRRRADEACKVLRYIESTGGLRATNEGNAFIYFLKPDSFHHLLH